MRRSAVVIAAVLAIGFLLLHGAGARAYVGVLSGQAASDAETALGLLYVVAWFGFVVVAPILTLAVILDAACGRLAARIGTWRAFRRR